MTGSQLINEIGGIRREFKPAMDNLFAGIVLGLLAVAAGLAAIISSIRGVIDAHGQLPFWADKGWCWFAAIGFFVLGIMLMVGAIFLIRWVRKLFSFRIIVGANGLFVFDRTDARIILWDEIASVTETHLYERPPILKGAAKYVLPKFLSKSFMLQIRAGKTLGFDGNNVKNHVQLAQLIRVETDALAIPWTLTETQGY